MFFGIFSLFYFVMQNNNNTKSNYFQFDILFSQFDSKEKNENNCLINIQLDFSSYFYINLP